MFIITIALEATFAIALTAFSKVLPTVVKALSNALIAVCKKVNIPSVPADNAVNIGKAQFRRSVRF